MNAQLVKTLAQIIKTLSEEERILLESELDTQQDWENHFLLMKFSIECEKNVAKN